MNDFETKTNKNFGFDNFPVKPPKGTLIEKVKPFFTESNYEQRFAYFNSTLDYQKNDKALESVKFGISKNIINGDDIEVADYGNFRSTKKSDYGTSKTRFGNFGKSTLEKPQSQDLLQGFQDYRMDYIKDKIYSSYNMNF